MVNGLRISPFTIYLIPFSKKGWIRFFKSIDKYCTTMIWFMDYGLWFMDTHSPYTKYHLPYYLIFNVTIANTTHRIVTIQNLVTILLSLYPSF